MKHVYTITAEDVGKRIIKKACPYCEHSDVIYTPGFMGPVQVIDIGKRIYTNRIGRGTIHAIESQEQFEARQGRGA